MGELVQLLKKAQPYRHRGRGKRVRTVCASPTRHSIRSIVSNVLIYAGWAPVGRGKDMQITDEADTLEDLLRLSHATEGLHPALIDHGLANSVLAARHKRVFLVMR